MAHKSRSVKWLLFAVISLLLAGFVLLPGLAASASPTTGLPIEGGADQEIAPRSISKNLQENAATRTPSPTRTPMPTATFFARGVTNPKKLLAWYYQLRGDIADLNGYNAQCIYYRDIYYSFLLGEQYHQHETKVLEQGLAYFDTLYASARAHDQAAVYALAYPQGLGNGGKTVTGQIGFNIDWAMSEYVVARSYYARAIYVLHSSMNLYHQVSGLGVPDLPKDRLDVYSLEKRTGVRR